jgi:7,8-dihydro-6-hydroxymethylpterin dimethyltransferase
MVRYAYEQPIQVVMVNTNGIRLARDPELIEQLAEMKDRLEIYLQFDGFDAATSERLRGERLVETKLKALENLERAGIRSTLVCTVEHTTNLHEVGRILKFGLERREVRGVSYQLATYCGRHLPAADLEHRVTMPDLAKALVSQTGEMLAETDFYPLPCAHPNCHLMAYLYRGGKSPVPVSRLIDVTKHMDLVANSIVYTPHRAKQIVARAIDASGNCGCGPNGCAPAAADDFASKALAETLTGADVFRVTLTAFLDAHTFDTRRVMKCCLAHVLPSGHVVPFCAYNTLYRDGHVPLPPLADGTKRTESHHLADLKSVVSLDLISLSVKSDPEDRSRD